jgi:hypothetical protein
MSESNRAIGIQTGMIYIDSNKIIIQDSTFWKTNIYEDSWQTRMSMRREDLKKKLSLAE